MESGTIVRVRSGRWRLLFHCGGACPRQVRPRLAGSRGSAQAPPAHGEPQGSSFHVVIIAYRTPPSQAFPPTQSTNITLAKHSPRIPRSPRRIPLSPRRQVGGDAEGRGGLPAAPCQPRRAPLCLYETSPPARSGGRKNLSPRLTAGGDAEGRGGAPPEAEREAITSTADKFGRAPQAVERRCGARGEGHCPTDLCPSPCPIASLPPLTLPLPFPAPPAARWGEMPKAEGGAPPASANLGVPPSVSTRHLPPLKAGGEGKPIRQTPVRRAPQAVRRRRRPRAGIAAPCGRAAH